MSLILTEEFTILSLFGESIILDPRKERSRFVEFHLALFLTKFRSFREQKCKKLALVTFSPEYDVVYWGDQYTEDL
jgi:hypothetical protein